MYVCMYVCMYVYVFALVLLMNIERLDIHFYHQLCYISTFVCKIYIYM